MLVAVLLSAACPGVAVAGGTTAKPAATAAPQLAVPEPRALIVMIRSTLMALHHANLTGNYTVLHDLASETFQQAHTAAQIGQAFAPMIQQGLDLSQSALLTPQLTQTPAIDGIGLLQLTGFFASVPKQIHFQIAYQPSPRGWRLFALAVTPVQQPQARPHGEK